MYKKWKPSITLDEFDGEFVEHPISMVETATLSMCPPPALSKKPSGVVKRAHQAKVISTFQYETVMCASRALQLGPRGFLLADSTGSGKSRTIAAVILDHAHESHARRQTSRAVWVSASQHLQGDALSEIRAVAGDDQLRFAAPEPTCTATRVSRDNTSTHAKPCIAFMTYPRLRNQRTLILLLNWLRGADAKLIVFDEAHAGKNAKSKTAIAMQMLQTDTQMDASVLYSSATPVSALPHMAYMSRLGLWRTPAEHAAFAAKFDGRGMEALELVAATLKRRGRQLSRSIDCGGIRTTVLTVQLQPHQTRLYDLFCTIASLHTMARQSVLLQLLCSFKVPLAIQQAERALAEGKSVVVGIQRTGESAYTTGHSVAASVCAEMNLADSSSYTTPPNPADVVLAHFGPGMVAEITGRRRRPVVGPDGQTATERVPPLSEEVRSFQTGQKRVALLSDAGGTGISLHATGTLPIVHIVLELPWSAEKFIQQCGRTHRTGQTFAPEYVFVQTDVPGEHRQMVGVRQKLNQLGAIARGDRKAACAHGSGGALGHEDLDARVLKLTQAHLLVRWVMRSPPLREYIASSRPAASPRLAHDQCLSGLVRELAGQIDIILSGDHSTSPQRMMSLVANVAALIHSLSHIGAIPCPRQYPDAYVTNQEWSPQNAAMYGSRSQARVEAVLAAASSSGSSIGSLPTDCVHHVLKFSESGQWCAWGGVGVESAMRSLVANTSHRQFCRASESTFFTKLLLCPVQVQRAVWAVVDDVRANFEGTRTPSARAHIYKTCYPRGCPKDTKPRCVARFHGGMVYCKVGVVSTTRMWPPHYMTRKWLRVCTASDLAPRLRVVVESANPKYAAEVWLPGRSEPSARHTAAEWACLKEMMPCVPWDAEAWARTRDTYTASRQSHERQCYHLEIAVDDAVEHLLAAEETVRIVYAEQPDVCHHFIGVLKNMTSALW